MEEKSPAKKAWETMKDKDPGTKAAYTKKRKEGARKAAAKVKNKQWEPEKVRYLEALKEKAVPEMCVVCGDGRPFVLQVHHADPEGKIKVMLCANCHDTVRRGTFENLREAHQKKEYKSTDVSVDRKDSLMSLAKECAKLLKEKYQVKRIFLIGSLVKGYVHERSDIDLVVEGLPPELYIDALVDLNDILERKIELNLIPFEDAFESLRKKTLREGKLIYG